MKRKLVCSGVLWVFIFSVVSAQVPSAQQTQPARPPLASPGPSAELENLVRLALERNPELEAARRGFDVVRSKISPAGALPDPELMFGQMNEDSLAPFTTLGDPEHGFSEVYVGLTQEFPFPGKRGLRRKVADMEAQAEASRYKSTRLRVISEVKTAFYDLYAIDKAIEIVERDRRLLEQLAKIASAKFSVGKGIQQDVLDSQVEITRVEERLSILRQRRQVIEALLNTLLYRPIETSVARVAEIQKSPLPYNLSELSALADRNYPLLEAQRRLIDRDAFALDLAKKGKYPDLGVTFVYHNRGSNPEYWTIGGTVKIPLYFGSKQRHEIEGAVSGFAQSRQAYQSARTQAFYRVKDMYLMATTAERLLKLYDEGIIRQASFSLESAVANYEVGKIDFLTLLTSWSRLLNYQVTYYEQLAEYQKALAQLEPLVGIELVQ